MKKKLFTIVLSAIMVIAMAIPTLAASQVIDTVPTPRILACTRCYDGYVTPFNARVFLTAHTESCVHYRFGHDIWDTFSVTTGTKCNKCGSIYSQNTANQDTLNRCSGYNA